MKIRRNEEERVERGREIESHDPQDDMELIFSQLVVIEMLS